MRGEWTSVGTWARFKSCIGQLPCSQVQIWPGAKLTRNLMASASRVSFKNAARRPVLLMALQLAFKYRRKAWLTPVVPLTFLMAGSHV